VLVGYDASGNPVTSNIEDLHVGDTVVTRNQDDPDAPLEEHAVTAISVSPVDHLRLLEIQEPDGTTQTLRTTGEHPFWVKDVSWVKAADLVAGQELITPDGRPASVLSSTREEHPEGISVYNLTVDEDHTYFVATAAGDEAVWVHNESIPPGFIGSPTSPASKPSTPPQPIAPIDEASNTGAYPPINLFAQPYMPPSAEDIAQQTGIMEEFESKERQRQTARCLPKGLHRTCAAEGPVRTGDRSTGSSSLRIRGWPLGCGDYAYWRCCL